MTIDELIARVRRYDPSADPQWLTRVYERRRRGPRGPAPRLGRVVHRAPAGGCRNPRRAGDGPRRRSPPRCCTTSSKTRRSPARRSPTQFGEEIAAARRRRDQTHAHPVSVQRRRAGREPAQDVPGDGQGHPRHHHQARRPPAQHADAREPPAGQSSRRSRARRSRSTRRSRTAWASGGSSGISRTQCLRYLDADAIPRHRRTRREKAPRARSRRRTRRSTRLRHRVREARHSRRNSTAAPSTSTRSTRRCKKGRDFSTIYDLTAIRIIVDTRQRLLWRARRRCTRCGSRCRGASKTISRCPSPTCTSRCIRPSSGRAAIRSRFRFARGRCTAPASTASRRTGATKKAARPTSSRTSSPGCASLLEWQNDMRDSRMFMENLKLDLFDSQVFVVLAAAATSFRCPAPATPLDFAYQVHTDVGNHCVGAKVNGKIVPLDYQLQERRHLRDPGQQVERRARRSTGSRSSRRRARSTRSSSGSARSARKRTCCPARRRSKRSSARPACAPTSRAATLLERIARKLNYATPTDLYAAIGFGDAIARSVANRAARRAQGSTTSSTSQTVPRPPDAARRAQRVGHPHRRRRRRARSALEVLLAGAGRSDHGLRYDRPRRLACTAPIVRTSPT